jgi:hypothetical protein
VGSSAGAAKDRTSDGQKQPRDHHGSCDQARTASTHGGDKAEFVVSSSSSSVSTKLYYNTIWLLLP